jgi:hypothetical protein
MKIGVSIAPRAVTIRPRRAFEPGAVARSVKKGESDTVAKQSANAAREAIR